MSGAAEPGEGGGGRGDLRTRVWRCSSPRSAAASSTTPLGPSLLSLPADPAAHRAPVTTGTARCAKRVHLQLPPHPTPLREPHHATWGITPHKKLRPPRKRRWPRLRPRGRVGPVGQALRWVVGKPPRPLISGDGGGPGRPEAKLLEVGQVRQRRHQLPRPLHANLGRAAARKIPPHRRVREPVKPACRPFSPVTLLLRASFDHSLHPKWRRSCLRLARSPRPAVPLLLHGFHPGFPRRTSHQHVAVPDAVRRTHFCVQISASRHAMT